MMIISIHMKLKLIEDDYIEKYKNASYDYLCERIKDKVDELKFGSYSELSSLPTQTTLFEVNIQSDTLENGSYSTNINNYFYRTTGVSTGNSPYNPPTSSITGEKDVDRGYWYKVQILSWNLHLNGLPYSNTLLEKKIYIP